MDHVLLIVFQCSYSSQQIGYGGYSYIATKVYLWIIKILSVLRIFSISLMRRVSDELVIKRVVIHVQGGMEEKKKLTIWSIICYEVCTIYN